LHWYPPSHCRRRRSHAFHDGETAIPCARSSVLECRFPFRAPTPMVPPDLRTTTQRRAESCKEPEPFPEHPRPMTPFLTRRAQHIALRLGNEGAGGRGLVLPRGREDADGLVVAGQAVDAGLDENQAELGVLVLAVALKVLADGNSLVDNLAQALLSLQAGPLAAERAHGSRRARRDILPS
jgi:hypothetical protein